MLNPKLLTFSNALFHDHSYSLSKLIKVFKFHYFMIVLIF